MKLLKYLIVLVAALVTIGAIQCEASKRTVAIMPIDNISDEYDISSIMAEQLTVALHNSGSYTVVERTELGQILKEGGFQHSGAVDMDSAINLGMLAGAKYSLISNITMVKVDENPNYKYTPNIKLLKKAVDKFKGRVSLTFRLIDNETGKDVIVSSVDVSETADDQKTALHDTCVKAAKKVMQNIQKFHPFTARILEVQGDVLYIDQGLDSGIRVGEVFDVAREGDPIIKNDMIVAMTQTPIGKAKITEVNTEYSICKVISKTEEVKKNDILKRGQ